MQQQDPAFAAAVKKPPRSTTIALPEIGISEEHFHRLFGIAFWVTGDEEASEMLVDAAWAEACRRGNVTTLGMDRAMVYELRELLPASAFYLIPVLASGGAHEVRQAKLPEVEQAVLALPVLERVVYILHHGLGYNYAEVATMLQQVHARHDLRAVITVAGTQALLRIRENLVRARRQTS